MTDPTILSVRVDESLYFANARALEDAIYDRVANQPTVKHVILMCPAVNAIDASALESLEVIAHRLQSTEVGFHLSEVKGPVLDALKRSDFLRHFKGRIFPQFEALTALAGAKPEETAKVMPISGEVPAGNSGSSLQTSKSEPKVP